MSDYIAAEEILVEGPNISRRNVPAAFVKPVVVLAENKDAMVRG